MALTLTIPKLNMSTTEAILAEWVAADGSRVEEGDVLYLLESDKATEEIVSPEAGKLVHKVAAGETYPVGTEIAVIE